MTVSRAQFTALYEQHLPAVNAYLRRRVARDDVDDLAADVFAVAWRKRDAVAPGEELPWLYRIAGYLVANHRRRLASRASVLGWFAVPDSAPPADAALDGDPTLAAAWASLSATEREVLALVVIDDLAVADAAVALRVTPNAVSVRLHRAKKSLAAALGASGGYDPE